MILHTRRRFNAALVMVLPKKIVVDGLPFCDYIPRPFTSLAQNKKGLIAASRLDGSIDVYDENDHFYLLHHIPPWILTSIYALCWSNMRLFATGGEGRVFELNTTSIQPTANLLLPGGLPARSLVSHDEMLVSGNDGGYINLIEITDGSLELKSCLAKLEGKILSLAVDKKSGYIVAAGDSKGNVHLFDLRNSTTLSVYSIGDEHCADPPIVWSLLFVGNTLFSGDSRGNVCVWDVELGALVSSFRSHAADVLALAVSENNQSIFAAGADPIIQRFDLCQTAHISQWQPSGVIRGSRRDIRSLVFVQHGESGGLRSCSAEMDHLIAAGNDARLQILPCPQSSPGDKKPIPRRKLKKNDALNVPPPIYLPFWPLSVTPTLPLAAHFAHSTFTPNYRHSARLCLVQHAEYMCLYRLPPKAKRMSQSKMSVRYFTKLAHIQPKMGNHIISCCISSCGRFMAYSDDVRARILKIEHPNSWKFNPDEPAPLVAISRLGWPRIPRSFQSRASSTSSDADNTDSEDGSSRFLFLDQSSADLFVTNAAGGDADFDEHLVSRKRKMAAPTNKYPSVEECHQDEVSTLPPASLMAFSPSSICLVCVSVPTQQVVCRRLDTGAEVWNFTPQTSSMSGTPSPIHLLKMAQLCSESKDSGSVTLLAAASLDERVSVYAFNEASSGQSPQHLFTCPLAANPSRPGHHPRPLAIALHVSKHNMVAAEEGGEVEATETNEVRARVTVLYTTGQLTEWILPLRLSGGVVHLVGTPQINAWLEEFWRRHGVTWRRYMPRFHSLDYFFDSHILMLASRRFCLAVDRRKQLNSKDIHLAFRGRHRKLTDGCLRIFGQVKNMLHCTVLADRVAAFQMDARTAINNLPAPLKKKRFGT
ncbi:U3 small nucleolar RNA-associated protein 4 [Echinococcus granulosus]|nr:U3 small nucleolar RNA-associated protein 4 [Echinococcus granulosus]